MNSLVALAFLISLIAVDAEKQWLMHSENTWDKEWKSGAWEYLETVPVERSRIAVIGGVLIPMYASKNASVLEVGCGEGAITDYFPQGQKAHYVGLDISKEAIHAAKKARGPPLRFVHATAHEFQPTHKFDVIVFSEVLYYVEHEKVLKQYRDFLNPNGLVIISIFRQSEKQLYENIFEYARQTFDKIDEMDISGLFRRSKNSKQEKTAFRLEVYRLKK